LLSPDGPIEEGCAVARYSVNLKNVLGDIHSNCRDLHGAALFKAANDIFIMAHFDAI